MQAFQDQTPCILDQSKVVGLPKKVEWLEFNNSASILEKNQYPIQKRRWNSNQMRKSSLLKQLIVFISFFLLSRRDESGPLRTAQRGGENAVS
ncbi:hypothetical protein TorRG33x02_304380 [Trema orientale]|uniref:Uncharacterized protein n=1 Tax=Trema orientale TaxID=63057 RepID=A0A2P5BY81_TREOI|nr:hypothetical protein TorRG33x02_304380 [Trema orientale]